MTYPMTKKGYADLQQELRHLKTVVRRTVIADLAEARSHGDLSENAEYDAAKERQSFVETRIRELETKIAMACVIDTMPLHSNKVIFGATVTIWDKGSDTMQVWTLVGEDEADLKMRKLSIASPLGRGLVGKAAGDCLEIETPKGTRECQIMKIEFENMTSEGF